MQIKPRNGRVISQISNFLHIEDTWHFNKTILLRSLRNISPFHHDNIYLCFRKKFKKFHPRLLFDPYPYILKLFSDNFTNYSTVLLTLAYAASLFNSFHDDSVSPFQISSLIFSSRILEICPIVFSNIFNHLAFNNLPNNLNTLKRAALKFIGDGASSCSLLSKIAL